ncbi:MAG TPA: DUF5673 domain-containing protein [Dehalococcoidia bacterium]|jgi:hypothetical protein|nr:DUF5673 domain-containing protein [Dehalococcoidia bacterium]
MAGVLYSAIVVGLVVIVVGFAWQFGRSMARKRGGLLLIQLGRDRRQVGLTALALLVLTGVALAALLSETPHFLAGAAAVALAGLSIQCQRALPGNQIRERGIWCSGQLLRWEDIAAYGWNQRRLVLQTRPASDSLGRALRLSIPADQRTAVERLLAERRIPAEHAVLSSGDPLAGPE